MPVFLRVVVGGNYEAEGEFIVLVDAVLALVILVFDLSLFGGSWRVCDWLVDKTFPLTGHNHVSFRDVSRRIFFALWGGGGGEMRFGQTFLLIYSWSFRK